MMQMQGLTFMVSLLDKTSGPANKIAKTLDNVTTRIQSGYQKIGYGAAGVAGAGYSLDKLIEPTKQMQAALGEVKSLDVTDDVLTRLTKTSLTFSRQYGESAVDFVRSSYDIQSAIAGLSGDELPAFTRASNILAKGTKADAATITNYVGTMYGIFQKTADGMGKAAWVEKLAGQTAMAVQMYKTTGQGMSDAFRTLGASATTSNVPMNEQIAILGKLQAAMSGSEAGTKYRAFLRGVGKAQGELGLQFTDSHGRMLPMVDILTKIQGKFGDMDKVATSDLMGKAFGGDEAAALLKLLTQDITGLDNGITAIGQNTGMDKAVAMAKALTNPWDMAAQGVNSLQIAIGVQLLPQIIGFYDLVNSGIETMSRWAEMFPELSSWVGIITAGFFGLVAAGGALMIIGGGLGAMFAVLSSPITGVVVAVVAVVYQLYRLSQYIRDVSAEWQVFETIAAGWDAVTLAVTNAIDFIMGKFNALKDWLHNFNLWNFLLSGVDALIAKINLIPGVNIDMGGLATPTAKPISAPSAMRTSAPKGGLMQKFSQMNDNKNQSRSIGTVNVYPQNPRSLSQLVDDIQMAGG